MNTNNNNNKDGHIRTPSTLRRKLMVAVIGSAAAITAFGVGTAVAGSGTLVHKNSAGTITSEFDYNVHTTIGEITGTVWDTASDGLCARAYVSTYNAPLGWNSWTYLGQACGYGNGLGVSKWLDNGYPFGTRISVCTGIPNSSRSNCSNRTTS